MILYLPLIPAGKTDSFLIEIFFQLLDHHAQTEYNYMVAFLKLRITGNHDTFSVPDQSSDGGTFRQTDVFDRSVCYAGSSLYGEFSYVGIGEGQTFYVRYICIKHHLI